MVRVSVVYQGDLRTIARHEPSSHELTTDAPVDNEGRGESFSPTDLVGTALGTCMLTIMGIVARRHDWDLTGARVTVDKHMATEPRRIGRLDVVFDLPGHLGEDARHALEKAAAGCPVHHSLHPDVVVDVKYRYGE